jgi:hypothetical protein
LCANPVTRGIGTFKRLAQSVELVIGWQKVPDSSQFHIESRAELVAYFKELKKVSAFLSRIYPRVSG